MGYSMSWSLHLDTPDGEMRTPVDGHTYNLSPMWRLAGVFENHPIDDLHGERAATIGIRAAKGLLRAVSKPAEFKALNPSNGWGDYEGFVKVLTRLAIDCAEEPEAIAHVYG